jgi:hypothetical protein
MVSIVAIVGKPYTEMSRITRKGCDVWKRPATASLRGFMATV